MSKVAMGIALTLLTAACSPYQSSQNPAGPQAERIHSLWIFQLIVATAVFILVIAIAAFVTRRAARNTEVPPQDERSHRRLTRLVAAATAVTVLILFASFIYSLTTGRALASLPARTALNIEITGYQWWWNVEYVDTVPSRSVVTANEIHVPVGVPVQIIAKSHDVIHSFWVPNLHGKKDMIPGHTTATWFQADTAGLYRGQCAEFCGHQHAKMALWVIAEPRDAYEKWYAGQLATPSAPTDSVASAGQAVFMAKTCTMCHAIGGTLAGSRVGLGPVGSEPDGPADLQPGELLVERSDVLVGTGSVPVRLGEVRPQGRRPMPAADWTRGLRPAPGTRFDE